MEFETNEEREQYLNARGKLILNACPGSGKTTSIAKKLVNLQKDSKANCGKYSGIVCLSFTNAAKNEIDTKYKMFSGHFVKYPNLVTTIDNFINLYITLPYYYLLGYDCKRPQILDDITIIDEYWKGKFKYKNKRNQLLYYSYKPSSIQIEQDGKFTTGGNKPNEDKVAIETFESYCKELKGWQFKKGLISTNDSAFIALYLIKKYPKIGNWLSNRFPHIIIDEAQDTSDLQHTIFDKIVKNGLNNIEFIADPYQSLYEWRNANPYHLTSKAEDWKIYDFTKNKRSPQRIINCFSLIKQKEDKLIESCVNNDKGIPITIYKYNSDSNLAKIIAAFNNICEYYDLSNNKILTRGNSLKNRLNGKEVNTKPWKSWVPYDLIEAINAYKSGNIKTAVNKTRKIATSLIMEEQQSDAHKIKKFENDCKSDYAFNSFCLSLLANMPGLEYKIGEWTKYAQELLTEELNLKKKLDFETKQKGSDYFKRSDLERPLMDFFVETSSLSQMPITTIHQIKGQTLDSVLLIFNEKKQKQNITFYDIKSSNEFPEEKQRIIYVGMSRPKHLLAMAFPEKIPNSEIQEKFGSDIEIINEDSLN